jgi:hypothetical protein
MKKKVYDELYKLFAICSNSTCSIVRRSKKQNSLDLLCIVSIQSSYFTNNIYT